MGKHKNKNKTKTKGNRGPVNTTSSISTNVTGPVPTVTLVMIVKNESKIITRLLNSCVKVIDNICICDTGSTDNTIAKIEAWAKDKNINCKIPVENFVNFSYSRTFSYVLGRHHFPDSDYFLLLDADMVLEVLPGFDKRQLTQPAYMLEQVSSTDRYWNMRIICNAHKRFNDAKWKCIGVTHEYWSATTNVHTAEFHKLRIDDREDGGAKADKYVRDERLFKIEFAKGINDVGLKTRYLYYLGQTMQCQRKWEEAIRYYRERSEVPNSFEEEGWYAAYRVGQCYMDWAAEIEYKSKIEVEVVKCQTNVNSLTAYIEQLDSSKVDEIKLNTDKLTQEKSKLINLEKQQAEIKELEHDMVVKYEGEDEFIEYEDNFVGIPDDPDEMLHNPLSKQQGNGKMVKVKLFKPTPQLFTRENAESKKALGLFWYMEAYNRRPTRLEPLYKAIVHYRIRGQNHTAMLLCDKASQIKYPSGDRLFVSYNNYEYELDFEIMINAFYVPDRKRVGRLAAKRLLEKISQGKVPDRNLAVQTCKNAKFYSDLHNELKSALKYLGLSEKDLS